MWSKEGLAWVGGFYTGEGCVSAFTSPSHRGKPALTIQINQVEREPLERVQKLLGLGIIRGPYSKKRPNQRDQYHFVVTGFIKVQAVLAVLWPYLSPVKQEQARAALKKYHEHPARAYK